MWTWHLVLSVTAFFPALAPAAALAQSQPSTQRAGQIMPTGTFAIDDTQGQTIQHLSVLATQQTGRVVRLQTDLDAAFREGRAVALALSNVETEAALTQEEAAQLLCDIKAVRGEPCTAQTARITCTGSASCRQWVSSLSTGEQFILTEVERRQILDAMGYDFITGDQRVFDYRTADPEVAALWDKLVKEVLVSRQNGEIGTGKVSSTQAVTGATFSDRQVCTGEACEHTLTRAEREEVANRMGFDGAFGLGRFEEWRNATPARQEEFQRLVDEMGRSAR
ncbi:hypothetical protein [Oceanibaculum pacificum]|uniref:YARHG domain-containing protein n=1 Tax=Oceanibaculum pacificum TaxID=580166 RepID=A0A154WG22_9PROT|nr:hypothetical protein [Oceanibaculum pacificum]KZD12457.1 hypothetical protein AUP43_04715 [Oceanibaculum pacificum]